MSKGSSFSLPPMASVEEITYAIRNGLEGLGNKILIYLLIQIAVQVGYWLPKNEEDCKNQSAGETCHGPKELLRAIAAEALRRMKVSK